MRDSLHSVYSAKAKYVALIIVLGAAIQASVSSAGENRAVSIEFFIGSDQQIAVLRTQSSRMESPSFQVYVLDQIAKLELELSSELPSDPEQAKQVVLTRFEWLDPDSVKPLQNAALGLVKARQYGIDRYPAVVVDQKALIYGETDFSRILALYERWRAGGSR